MLHQVGWENIKNYIFLSFSALGLPIPQWYILGLIHRGELKKSDIEIYKRGVALFSER